LAVGEEESEWPGWVWCTNQAGKSRWVPEAYVERTGDSCVMLRDYAATELSVNVGEVLTIIGEEESQWVWCKSQAGRSGWVPVENLSMESES
jgi:hypothetical protein